MAALRLLQLPKTAQKNVLAHLSAIETIKLSFCSKKCKTLVKNVGLKASNLSVAFQNKLSIEIVIPNYMNLCLTLPEREFYENRHLDDPGHLENGHFASLELSFIQWITHFSYIFNTNKITKCLFSMTRCRYDMESIKRFLEGFTVRTLIVGRILSQNNFQPILTCGLLPKVLVLHRNTYEGADVLRKALAHNYDSIEIFDYFPEYFSKLHNVLAINSAVIKIRGSTFSDKSLNQFLKIWMKKVMPRLRKLQFYFAPNRVIDRNVVLKGIKYTVNPPKQERMMCVEMENRLRRDFVIGGLEITRIDRISATVIIGGRFFKFYVWDA